METGPVPDLLRAGVPGPGRSVLIQVELTHITVLLSEMPFPLWLRSGILGDLEIEAVGVLGLEWVRGLG